MRTFRKILVGIGLAAVLSLSVIWGTQARTIQHAAHVVAENIQKPGHVILADVVMIQKPGH
jgi:hypothetical protein